MRIEQDSDDNLQMLFDSVLKPGEKKILTIPLSMRKLPKSFFEPPSHSRENSIDSALGSSTTTPTPTSRGNAAGGGNAPVAVAGQQQHLGLSSHRLTISHSRAHSSPATLQQTYAAGQKLVQQQQAAAQAAAAAGGGAGGATGGATAGPQTATGNSAGSSSASSMSTPLKAVHASQRSYDVVSAIQLQATT